MLTYSNVMLLENQRSFIVDLFCTLDTFYISVLSFSS